MEEFDQQRDPKRHDDEDEHAAVVVVSVDVNEEVGPQDSTENGSVNAASPIKEKTGDDDCGEAKKVWELVENRRGYPADCEEREHHRRCDEVANRCRHASQREKPAEGPHDP